VTLDLQVTTVGLFDRIAVDAAGSAVRALLGLDDPASLLPTIIPAARLAARPLPPAPFLAWRGGAVGGESLEMRRITGVWWAYDLPIQGYARINAVLAALEAAYPQDAIPWGRVRVTAIGQETDDRSLGGLLTRSLHLTYTRRA
jgi:hypothetical protein